MGSTKSVFLLLYRDPFFLVRPFETLYHLLLNRSTKESREGFGNRFLVYTEVTESGFCFFFLFFSFLFLLGFVTVSGRVEVLRV